MKRNNINIFSIFCIFCIVVSITLTLIISNLKKEPFVNNLNFEVKDSVLLNNGERGLFAQKSYKKGDLIETCPTLIMKNNEVSDSNIINEHFFQGNKESNSILSLGYCSLLNHSIEKQNCMWKVGKNDKTIKMFAIDDINKGDELYLNYGDDYWSNKSYLQY